MKVDANPYSLIDANDSLLILVDVQDTFLQKLPSENSERLLNNIRWIVKLAQWKGIPLVATAEDSDRAPVTDKLVEALPAGTQVFNKLVFGLAHQPDILAAVEQTGRRTVVLLGLETDVCVLHSALGLLERGYRVAVAADATGTPAPNHEPALERMRSAGAVILNMKGLFYEWLRTVEEVKRFHRENPEMREQAGVTL